MRFIARYVALFRLLWLTSKVKGEFPILKVVEDAGEIYVLLPHSADTQAIGIQSLFWSSRRGHCVVEPAHADEDGRWFKVLKTFGIPVSATGGAWLSGWLGERPEHFGFLEYKTIRLANGTQAWLTTRNTDSWVIHVHGRKTLMGETLRNFRLFHNMGFKQLTISHETDPKPLGLSKHRSTLGIGEWLQVERAVEYAKQNGAKRIVLFGWSLGGMMVGQFLARSNQVDSVEAAIFDSPMFDVRNTLRFQAKLANFDDRFADEVSALMEKSTLLKLLGYPKLLVDDFSLGQHPIVKNLPMLVMYSSNDGYVEAMDAVSFAGINPSVEIVEFPGARHCRLKNSDPSMYEDVIRKFVSKL